jgi:hypothetical protein
LSGRGLPGTPPGCTARFDVVEVCLRLSYIIVICQLTTAHAVFYDHRHGRAHQEGLKARGADAA